MNPAKLLSGGNPQIPKGYGDRPVQDYLDALPGWKRATGRRLDEIIHATVPDVQKAVKWNSPLYGVDGVTWFLGMHGYDRYLKLAFFQGASLIPLPPDASKQPNVRYLNLYEGKLDEALFASWVLQASKLPGTKM